MDKILQLFFTTKPARQACRPLYFGRRTGLGLSLSYNIVKTYGGELKVEQKKPVRPVHAGGPTRMNRSDGKE